MILTADQQRWCAEHTLGSGFDDDNPDLVQYTHVCEFVGGDGDAPRPKLAERMTHKKLVRVRRAQNAWARLLARDSGRRIDGELVSKKETAHYWRCREDEDPSLETTLPGESPRCDGCYAWIGKAPHRSVFGAYYRSLKYCFACVETGTSERDYESRAAAYASRRPALAYEPQTSVALCRSPRLWGGRADQLWPGDITCEDCVRILRERAPEVFVPHVPIG